MAVAGVEGVAGGSIGNLSQKLPNVMKGKLEFIGLWCLYNTQVIYYMITDITIVYFCKVEF